MISELSLAVVGADYPNRRGPGRRFEIAICRPGEPVHLRPEPKNPADPRAVAVDSIRGVCIGYLTAERCGLIGKLISEGRPARAIFQRAASYGAVIRVSLDGNEPSLPPGDEDPGEQHQSDDGFWPDQTYDD